MAYGLKASSCHPLTKEQKLMSFWSIFGDVFEYVNLYPTHYTDWFKSTDPTSTGSPVAYHLK